MSSPAARVLVAIIWVAALAIAQTSPLEKGLEAFRKGDYQTAEGELRSSSDPRARAFLALTLAATNRCDQAEAGLSQAAEAAKSDTQRLAGIALAQCDIARSRWDEAYTVVSKLKVLYPTDADVLYMSARLYMRAWNDTIYQLYKANPASFRVNQISGEILETQGQFTAAAAEYRKALEKNPDALNLHFRLGRALLMSSHSPETLEAALKEFETELSRNPQDAVAHYQVAQVLLAQDKPKDAGAHLERALQLNAGFPEALIALGKLRVDEKRNDEAIVMLSRATELMPRSEAAHYNLMMAYRNSGKMADARREKAELDKLQKVPEGEFTEFLKKLGEKPPEK
jgi:tetratricopeptide (TPR) repeat protein